MTTHLDEIKRDYIRLRANEQGLWLEVRVIEWNGPHTPYSNWTVVKRLGQPPAPPEEHAIPTISLPFNTDEHESNVRDHGSEGWIVTPQELEQSVAKLLANRRYFRVCSHCEKLFQRGRMFDNKTCHSCAVKEFGVVY